MKVIATTVLLSSALIAVVAQDSCVAPYNLWGPTCLSSKSLQGVRGSFVDYQFAVEGNTNVFCEVLGYSSAQPGSKCNWGW